MKESIGNPTGYCVNGGHLGVLGEHSEGLGSGAIGELLGFFRTNGVPWGPITLGGFWNMQIRF